MSTLKGLALQRANLEISRQGKSVLNRGQKLNLVEDIFLKNSNSSDENYFYSLEPTPGVIHYLSRTIDDMRLADIASGQLIESHFITSEKFHGIFSLLKDYEEYLEEKSFTDEVDLYRVALSQNTDSSADVIFIVLRPLFLSYLEQRFLNMLEEESSVIYLDVAPVWGFEKPARLPAEIDKNVVQRSNKFTWFLDPGKVPADIDEPRIELFRSEGYSNEIREIINRVIKNKIPLMMWK